MVLAPQSTDLPKLQLKPGRWTVGSAATCSYRVVGAGVQPRHALILSGGNAIILKTWDARTWVNGEPVRGEVKLNCSDRITFGSVDFEIEPAEETLPVEDPVIASEELAPNVEVQVTDAIDQLTETIASSLRAIDSVPATNIPDRAELEFLKRRISELEAGAMALTQELENSQHHIAILEEELALQKQLAATIELAKVDQLALTKRTEELEIVRANQEREKKVLAHSWDWLQTDRRQLVVEKEEWQQQYNQMLAQTRVWTAERDQWLKERDEYAASMASLTEGRAELEKLQAALEHEKALWNQERQQVEDEVRAVASDLDAARASIASQQAEVASEWSRLQATEESLKEMRADFDQKIGSLESVQTLLESQQSKLLAERQQLDADRQAFERETQTSSEPNAKSVIRGGPASEEQITADSGTPSPRTTSVTRRIAIVHENNEALLSPNSSGESWSHGVDLTEHTHNEFATFPRPELSDATEKSSSDPNEVTANSNDDTATTDPAAIELRAELARMFNLRELESASSDRRTTSNDDWPTVNESSTAEAQHASRATANDRRLDDTLNSAELPDIDLEPDNVVEQQGDPHKSFIRDEPLKEGSTSYGGVVMTTNTPAAQRDLEAIESLSFNDDEHVDKSVDRYMKGLLARSRGLDGPIDVGPSKETMRPVEVSKTVEAPRTVTETITTSEIPTLQVDAPGIEVRQPISESKSVTTQSPIPEATSSDTEPTEPSKPVHRQDKDALRAVTENMREVANLQALKNVETAGWVRLRDSIKIKSALAAFSFMLCLGLLYLGYRSQPGLIVLGGCAACIGILTWIDLFMAIYKVRHRSKELDEQRRKRS